jgi:dTDP-4-dehydrorhamnose reductase
METLDVRDASRCARAVEEGEADVIIHCAAYTDVDGAEGDERQAMEVNRDGARNMADAARAQRSLMIYLSTDYVFDGRASRPYEETDQPNPLGVYGRSKLAGEEAVRGVRGRHLIVRTSWLYGGGGSNFVDTIRNLARERSELRLVADQRSRPTWSRSLARTLLDLAASGVTGTIHGCDSGTASWYELAQAIKAMKGLSVQLVPIPAAEWKAAAPRPLYSVLNLEKAEGVLNRSLPPWEESLQSYLGESP